MNGSYFVNTQSSGCSSTVHGLSGHQVLFLSFFYQKLLHSCLIQNQNGSSYEVPLLLLIPHQLNPSQLRYESPCEDDMSGYSHPREVFRPGPSQLTFCPAPCSYISISLCSNSCSLYTRSQLSMNGLRLLPEESRPQGHCYSQKELPRELFLGKKDGCKFSIEMRTPDFVQSTWEGGRV